MLDSKKRIPNLSLGKRKVAIIGVGYVGASIAYALSIRNIAREIVLIDIDTEKAEGEALDIQHGIPYMGSAFVYDGDYTDCSDSDLIIICAGRNRKVGESRRDLAMGNIAIMKDICSNLKKYYTHGPILVVSNPVDILTYVVSEEMGLPNGRVFGTGCILDTSRFISCIADYTSLNTEVIKGTIVGEHGDCQTPVWSELAIAGEPMETYCRNVGLPWDDEQKNEIFSRVRTMGAEIIKRKGKTEFGIATCVCYLADTVLNQRLTIASVSSPMQGEYGVSGVALSVPSIIGVNGVERRLEEEWTEEEQKQFRHFAEEMKSFMSSLKEGDINEV